MATVVGMPELTEHARLDLADALAGNPKLAPNLFEGAILAIAETVAQLNDPPLALGQLLQHNIDLLAQDMLGRAIERRRADLIFDEIPQHRIAVGTDRRLERNRLTRDLDRTANLLGRDT